MSIALVIAMYFMIGFGVVATIAYFDIGPRAGDLRVLLALFWPIGAALLFGAAALSKIEAAGDRRRLLIRRRVAEIEAGVREIDEELAVEHDQKRLT